MITQVNIKTGEVTQRPLTPEELATIPVRTQEDIDKEARELFKQFRAEAVSQIVVEVDGLLFDGDETAQTRMTRAALVMQDDETTTWMQANNVPAEVTKAQLIEAIRLAGAEQTRLWVQPPRSNYVVRALQEGCIVKS